MATAEEALAQAEEMARQSKVNAAARANAPFPQSAIKDAGVWGGDPAISTPNTRVPSKGQQFNATRTMESARAPSALKTIGKYAKPLAAAGYGVGAVNSAMQGDTANAVGDTALAGAMFTPLAPVTYADAALRGVTGKGVIDWQGEAYKGIHDLTHQQGGVQLTPESQKYADKMAQENNALSNQPSTAKMLAGSEQAVRAIAADRPEYQRQFNPEVPTKHYSENVNAAAQPYAPLTLSTPDAEFNRTGRFNSSDMGATNAGIRQRAAALKAGGPQEVDMPANDQAARDVEMRSSGMVKDAYGNWMPPGGRGTGQGISPREQSFNDAQAEIANRPVDFGNMTIGQIAGYRASQQKQAIERKQAHDTELEAMREQGALSRAQLTSSGPMAQRELGIKEKELGIKERAGQNAGEESRLGVLGKQQALDTGAFDLGQKKKIADLQEKHNTLDPSSKEAKDIERKLQTMGVRITAEPEHIKSAQTILKQYEINPPTTPEDIAIQKRAMASLVNSLPGEQQQIKTPTKPLSAY